METEYEDDQFRWAVIYIKGNELAQAQRLLQRVLDVTQNPQVRTKANYMMSTICSDPVEKRGYLENALAGDPTHPEARRALAILDGKLKPSEIVNPDALPAQATGEEKTTADRFTCPKCGARMVFDGDGKTLVCEHCSRGQVLGKAAPQYEQDFIMAMATSKGHTTPVTKKTFTCQGCGAHFVLPAGQISTVCAYCGSPHVVTLTNELIEPDSIIPMGMDKNQAIQILITWVDKHRLRDVIKMHEPRGMYLPVWTFDLMGDIPWSGMVYRNKQRVPVSGDESVNFNNIPIPAVKRLADIMPRLLADLDTSNAPAYDERYLAGWPAEVHEQSMADASLDARQQAVERARARIRSDKGYVEDLNYSTSNLSILSFRLLLFPVWYSAYKFEGKDYRVVINGVTGKVYGETKHQGILGWLEEALGLQN